jgi:hypothetical protein
VTVRVVGDWVWRPENGYACEVNDALDAANLMTLPGFDVAEDEPLVALVGREHTFELALAGVASVGDLVALDEDGIVNAQCVCCVTREEVMHWVDVAGRGDRAQFCTGAGTTPIRNRGREDRAHTDDEGAGL